MNKEEKEMIRCPWDGKLYESTDKFPPEPKIDTDLKPKLKVLTSKEGDK